MLAQTDTSSDNPLEKHCRTDKQSQHGPVRTLRQEYCVQVSNE